MSRRGDPLDYAGPQTNRAPRPRRRAVRLVAGCVILVLGGFMMSGHPDVGHLELITSQCVGPVLLVVGIAFLFAAIGPTIGPRN